MPITGIKIAPTGSLLTRVNNGHVIVWRSDAASATWSINHGGSFSSIRGRHAQFYCPNAGAYTITGVFAEGTHTVRVSIPTDTRTVVDVAIGESFPTLSANTIYRFECDGTWTIPATTIPASCTITSYGDGAEPIFSGTLAQTYQNLFTNSSAGGAQLINVAISTNGRAFKPATPAAGAASNLIYGVTFVAANTGVNAESGGSFAMIGCDCSTNDSIGSYFSWLGNNTNKGTFIQIAGCTAYLNRTDAAVVRGHCSDYVTISGNVFNGMDGAGSAVRVMEGRYVSVTDNTLTGTMRFCENTATWGASYNPAQMVTYSDFLGNTHTNGRFDIGHGAANLLIDGNTFARTTPGGTWLVIDPQMKNDAGAVVTSSSATNITVRNNVGTMPGTNGAGDFLQVGTTDAITKIGYPSGIVVSGNQYDFSANTVAVPFALRLCGAQTMVSSCTGNAWTIKSGRPVGQINGSNVAAASWPFAGDTIVVV